MRNRKTSPFYLLALVCMAHNAQADAWDDFSNNLATDIAPILALFGEQVTKQFLSESITILDCFVFAMVPLGIITAIVSAIRVCGGPSLRAFIGRAQEGGGIAEAELCSSTSRDVCEMYHNGAIVRVFGRPKILEVVHDRKAADQDFTTGKTAAWKECGLFLSKDYFTDKEKAEKAGWKEDSVNPFRTWSDRMLAKMKIRNSGPNPSKDDTEKGSSQDYQHASPDDLNNDPRRFAPNPNLSFNVGIKKRSRYWTWLAAFFAFGAQASVIAFGAFVTKRGWKKEDEVPPIWGFPFMCVGTILLCAGMFHCASLVEKSTDERVFTREKNEAETSQSAIYVVQPGNQTIGDQTFDSFLFKDTDDPMDHYITSWKTAHRSRDEIWVWIAAMTSLVGFVFQFVGFRAMHSAVSILQLGAIVVVSAMRALLRTQRLRPEGNALQDRADQVEGHELDWLALQLTVPDISGTSSSGPAGPGGPASTVSSENDVGWVVVGPTVASGRTSRQNAQNGTENHAEAQRCEEHVAPAVKTFHYRRRLAELTSQFDGSSKSRSPKSWSDDHVAVRELARQLRKTIESSVKTIFPKGSGPFIDWSISVAQYTKSNLTFLGQGMVTIRIPLQTDNDSVTAWESVQRHLEAVLGLWTWSILSDRRLEKLDKEVKTTMSRAAEIPACRIASLHATEENLKRMIQDLQLWSDEFSTLTTTKIHYGDDPMKLGPHVVWTPEPQGSQPQNKQQAWVESASTVSLYDTNQPLLRMFGWQSITLPRGTFALTTSLNCSIVAACAQDLYQAFLSHVMSDKYADVGQVRFSESNRDSCIQNKVVTELVDAFQKNALGSTADAFSVVLPALQDRLGSVLDSDTLDNAYSFVENVRESGEFQRAENVLKWAWEAVGQMSSSDPQKQSTQESIMLELGELYRHAYLYKDGSNSQKEFARQGIAWMLNMSASMETPKRYNDLLTKYLDGDNSAHVKSEEILQALSDSDRTKTLWLVSHVKQPLGVQFKGRTALSLAAERGWLEIVKIVLKVGSWIDREDTSSRTPLSHAAEHGHVDVAKILMKRGALPTARDSSGRTPLSYAAAGGHTSVMRLLLDDTRVMPQDNDNDKNSILHWAAKTGNETAIDWLFKRNTPVEINGANGEGHSPLISALLGCHIRTANLLIDLGANTNIKIQSTDAWRWAIKTGEWECAEFLLACLNEDGTGTVKRSVLVELPPFSRSSEIVSCSESALDGIVGDPLPPPQRESLIMASHVKIHDMGHNTGHTRVESWGVTVDSVAEFLQGHGYGSFHTPQFWLLENCIHVEQLDFDDSFKFKIPAFVVGQLNGTVTEDIIKAALQNNDPGDATMRYLLKQMKKQGMKFEVTENVLKDSARHRESEVVLGLLLEQGGKELKVTEDVVKAAAGNTSCGYEVVRLLLEQRGEEVKITEGIVKEAAGNYRSGYPVMRLLLEQRGKEIEITEDVVKTAAGNTFCGDDVMRLLLEQRGEEVKITEGIVKKAVQNYTGTSQVMRLLLEQRGEEVKITEDVVKAAAGIGSYGYDLMRLLLEQRGEKVKVTEDLVKVVAGNRYSGEKVMRLLLEENVQMEVTEGLSKTILENFGENITDLFLEQYGEEVGLRVTEDIVQAAEGSLRSGETKEEL